jgi:transposase
LRVPQRDQIELRSASLDQLVPADHQVRVVWECVQRLDLSRWLEGIQAVDGAPGRDATDPRLLVALWVYATLDGEGSARELARLCSDHLIYQWLCGGVSVNHHLLSDFRSQRPEAWDELLTQIVGSLLHEGLVTMQRVAQDGMKVRASAGKSSFRRKATLENCLAEARAQVERLRAEHESSDDDQTPRRRAARRRAAEERAVRIEHALRQCEALQAQRESTAKKSGRPAREARASTTDPDARVMQFSDGGFRPGYNVQFATDTSSGVIVGVEVVTAGTDHEQLPPMLDQLQQRYGRTPDEALVDGGFATLEAILAADAPQRGCAVYAPVKDADKLLKAGKDPYAPKKTDPPAVAAWRVRMGTAAAKAIYQLRCQTAEWVNALARNRGCRQFPVRGQTRCGIAGRLYAIVHNLVLGAKLRAGPAPMAT